MFRFLEKRLSVSRCGVLSRPFGSFRCFRRVANSNHLCFCPRRTLRVRILSSFRISEDFGAHSDHAFKTKYTRINSECSRRSQLVNLHLFKQCTWFSRNTKIRPAWTPSFLSRAEPSSSRAPILQQFRPTVLLLSGIKNVDEEPDTN